MRFFYYIVLLGVVFLTANLNAKENDMFDEKIDWHEYGRIEKGELTTQMQLLQTKDSVIAKLIFTNVSKRPLNVFTFYTESKLEVFLNEKKFEFNGPSVSIAPSKSLYTTIALNKKIEIDIDLVKNYSLPANAVGELTVSYWQEGETAKKQITLMQQPSM